MPKKLGKKARKFAKKNLQSVMKKKRKLNALHFKRNFPSRKGNLDVSDDHEVKMDPQVNGIPEGTNIDEAVNNNDLDSIFVNDDDEEPLDEDISDSDGYLTEDPDCPYVSGNESEEDTEGRDEDVLQRDNIKLWQEIAKKKSKLAKIREKVPRFSEYLESRRSDLSMSKDEEIFSDEEYDAGNSDESEMQESHASHDDKPLTSSTVDVWCWLVMEEPNGCALPNLLNAFRAACHYGVDEISCRRIPNRKIFSKILAFVLSESDSIFRRLLGISVHSGKESILKLANKSGWENSKPMIKSFLKSCLFLLNQEVDNKILIFVLSQLRSSVIFFAAFPILVKRLLKILVRLWATSDQSLSLSSYLLIREIALQLSSDWLDFCFSTTYKAFLSHCKFVETTDLDHIDFLLNSVVELYSLDIPKSYKKVLSSVEHLASILRSALNKKEKDQLQIQSWQYINCTRLWVKFVSLNCKEHDLQQLIFLVIQVVRGIAQLFPGLRNLPLRFMCVKMLNEISISTGVFISVASLVFDCFEERGISKEDRKLKEPVNFSSLLKVPKQLLKSRTFHEQCVLKAIELLSAHFTQWSYHVSFPELTTIPLILLKRFHEKSTLESVRRPVMRLIDQVQLNSDYIQRKREEVPFSPKDQELIDNFLQLEKNIETAPFTRYYNNITKDS